MKCTPLTALFVFGTLLDEDVLRIVLGRELPSSSRRCASLADHCRLKQHDDTYPIVERLAGGKVPGQLLMLNEQDMARVRFFEAEEYELESTQVLAATGEVVEAMFCAERATWPGPRYSWSLRQWQRDHKGAFVEHASAYMALYGTMTAARAHAVWKALVGRE